MPRHVFECPLRWSDMDALRHINNVQYVRFLEEARADWLFHRGDVDRSGNEGVMVIRNEIDYRRQLHYRHRPVPVELWVSRLGRASFEVRYQIVDTDPDTGDRTVFADAKSVLATVSLRDGHPKRVSPELYHYLEQFTE